MKKPHVRLAHSWIKGDEFAGLPGEAIKLYVLLLSYAKGTDGDCWPSQETLAKRTGTSIPTVYRMMVELENRYLVEVINRGKGKVNNYKVQIDPTVGIISD